MSIDQLTLEEFKKIFSGSERNFYNLDLSNQEWVNGKLSGDYTAITNQLITLKDYENHLLGKTGLGIIPIKENNKCRFSVIDVDIYDRDISKYIEANDKHEFPLVPFKSKSGGYHLFLFFDREESTKEVLIATRKLASLLSIDMLSKKVANKNVEIFPKQSRLNKGDTGNAINLPYFNYGNDQRVAIFNGKELNLQEAINHIKNRTTTLEELQEFFNGFPYNDAPPCIQSIYVLDPLYLNSGRNTFLFSLGVYLKKKDEEFFEQYLLEVNQNLKYPLSEKEIEKTILSSLRKKDYEYKCKEDPCSSYCNKKECSKREYGVGKNDGYFSTVETGKLFQFKSQQPYYEWEVRLHGQENYKKLLFKSEDEIIKQDTFLRLCMRELYELPSKMKQIEWFKKVNQALTEVVVIKIEEEDDTSPIILLKDAIVEFLIGRAEAKTKEQILAGRVWYDPVYEGYFFRVKDLTQFVFSKKKVPFFKPNELHAVLKNDMNAKQKHIRTENNKQIRATFINKRELKNYETEIDSFKADFSDLVKEEF